MTQEGTTYRCGVLRITYRTEGMCACKDRPWMVVIDGTVTTRTGA